jgi:STE24 endopeptidase
MRIPPDTIAALGNPPQAAIGGFSAREALLTGKRAVRITGMSFLLMVFLTLVCVVADKPPLPQWPTTPEQSALLTGVAVLLVGLHAFWVSRRVSWPLARDPARRERLLARYERWRFLHQLLQFGVYILALAVVGWGWAVRVYWHWDEPPLPNALYPQALPGLELWTLAPFLVGQILTWLFFYDADRAAHRAAHRLLEADPFAQTWLEARPAPSAAFGGRWSYVGFQLRQKLALVFIPVLLLIVHKELFRPDDGRQAGSLASFALSILLVLGVFIGMPLLIRLALGLKPLPPGLLRDRLLATGKRLGFRFSDILLWNTRSGMANAMVIGLVPWLRYVVFTDRLIEEFPEEEVEAVFGHEIGHLRHQHMLYYLVFLLTSMAVLGLVTENYLVRLLGQASQALAEEAPWLGPSLAELLGPGSSLALFSVVAVLLVYIFAVFGFLSRRCERQADVFGCRALSCLDPACEGHTEETPLPCRGRGLCATGIHTFIRALEKVALINGISRDRPGFLQSWQHSTIARRVAFLRGLLAEPDVEPAFQARLWRVKAGLLAGLLAGLAVLLALQYWRW